MIDARDIRWLAGLLEGEGCFSTSTSPRNERQFPCLQVSAVSTDRDVLERAKNILGGKTKVKVRTHGYGKKVQYTVRVNGTLAASWMMTLYSLMGERRRARILELLNIWKAAPTVAESVKFRLQNSARTKRLRRLECQPKFL